LTAILAFAPALAAKVKRKAEPVDLELFETRARNAQLIADLVMVEKRNAELMAELDQVRQTLALERRMADQARQAHGLAYQQAQMAQHQGLAQMAQHQGLAQMAMQAQNFAAGAQLGQLGAQNAQNAAGAMRSFEELCNCVPARHDMFNRQSGAR
jgi:hypothetical protein